ncbi:hypothetical protein, partial [Prevotella sp.]|uniref:hypothetical protein n=1 Tax=Prevotella sp. TaxID=59823 RepID=UPI0027E26527
KKGVQSLKMPFILLLSDSCLQFQVVKVQKNAGSAILKAVKKSKISHLLLLYNPKLRLCYIL